MNEYLFWFRAATAIKKDAEQQNVASGRHGEVSKPETPAKRK